MVGKMLLATLVVLMQMLILSLTAGVGTGCENDGRHHL